MKNFLLAVFIFGYAAVGLASSAFAQGNLQFNRPIIESVSISASGYFTRTITVPTGKVWKVEQASIMNDDATPADLSYNSASSGGPNMYIDGFGLLPVQTSGGTAIVSSRLPLWLPEGTYTLKVYYPFSTLPALACFNAIEFNLVP